MAAWLNSQHRDAFRRNGLRAWPGFGCFDSIAVRTDYDPQNSQTAGLESADRTFDLGLGPSGGLAGHVYYFPDAFRHLGGCAESSYIFGEVSKGISYRLCIMPRKDSPPDPGAKLGPKSKITVSIGRDGHEVITDVLKDNRHLKNNTTAALEFVLDAYRKRPSPVGANTLLKQIRGLIEISNSQVSQEALDSLEAEAKAVQDAMFLLNHANLCARDIFRRVSLTPNLMRMRDCQHFLEACMSATVQDVAEFYKDDWHEFATRLSQKLRESEKQFIRRVETFVEVCYEMSVAFQRAEITPFAPGIIDLYVLDAVILQATGQIEVIGFPGTNRPNKISLQPSRERSLRLPSFMQSDDAS